MISATVFIVERGVLHLKETRISQEILNTLFPPSKRFYNPITAQVRLMLVLNTRVAANVKTRTDLSPT